MLPLSRVPILVTALVICAAGVAAAQALPPPTGGSGGLFGRRTVQDPQSFVNELTMMLDLGSGYDRNRDQEARAEQGGMITTGGATIQHRVGRATRFVESDVRMYTSRASVGIKELSGASGSLEGEVSLGRRAGLTTRLTGNYEPTFLFEAFGPLETGDIAAGLPGANQPQGISDQRWLSTQGTAGGYRRWTSRQRTDLQVGAMGRRVVRGTGLDSRGQSFTALHAWERWRHGSVTLRSRWEAQQQEDARGADLPIEMLAPEVVLRIERPLSATRRMGVSVGLGMTQVKTESADTREAYAFTVPTVSGSARVDVSRNWALGADARRDVSVLQGISPVPFVTNAASVRLSGTVGARTQVSVSTSWSKGNSEFDAGRFTSVVGTAQVQVAATRQLGIFAGIGYYDHDVQDLVIAPDGFPGDFRRRSVRVGLTYWLPVFGKF